MKLEIPDEIYSALEARVDVQRFILEALAVEAYRALILSRGQVQKLLDMNFWEAEKFLKEHEAWLHNPL